MNRNISPKIRSLIRIENFKNVFINILLLLLLLTPSIKAQETLVVGQVLNSVDKTPIPSVNISFKNSQTSTQSNEEGYFMIRTNERKNTLVFTSIGYKKHEI